jgi:hypothetical protein
MHAEQLSCYDHRGKLSTVYASDTFRYNMADYFFWYGDLDVRGISLIVLPEDLETT